MAVDPTQLQRVVDVAAANSDVVVLHLSRAVDGLGRVGFETADRVLEVLTLDMLSFRATKRALDLLRPIHLEGRLGFVVNRASRAEITVRDVERVFGCEPIAVVQADRSVGRVQDHGRLLSPRGRTGRVFNRLAERLVGVLLWSETLPGLTPGTGENRSCSFGGPLLLCVPVTVAPPSGGATPMSGSEAC